MTRTARILFAAFLTLACLHTSAAPTRAASAAEISASARQALRDLYASTPAARVLGEKARGILVFPSIVKGGFIFGAEYGNGALFRRGSVSGYYNTSGASYGFQAGIQKYGYALFLMTDAALRYLDQSQGFELGAGPSLVVVDKGFAKKLTTTTLQNDMYAFVFDQQGLMGGISLQGTKVTRIHPQ
jgi:lipid-binding SYLF domain-containing protein